MKKFTLLMVALLIAAMGFAQATKIVAPKKAAKAETTFTVQQGAMLAHGTRAVTGTLQLCGEQNANNGIGTGSAATLSAGARFEATDLTSYVGQYITRISVGIADATVISSAKVAILTGTTAAPVVATEQACTLVNGVNEVLLSVPYQIPAETAIMIAYELVVTGGYPLGVDAGPAVNNAGFLAIGALGTAFMTMEENDLDFNNIISATVEDEVSSDPILAVAPSSLSFVGYVGDAATEAKTVTVTGVNITDNITITTEAPFEVSADNTVFASTIAMTEAGTFYVRYIPGATEANGITGTVTVATPGAESKTVALSAVNYNCLTGISSLPFSEDFEAGELNGCWSAISMNTENESRMGIVATDNSKVFRFSSYTSTEGDYSQYLITPIINMTEDFILSFDYAMGSSYSDGEGFTVMTSTTDNAVASFTALGEETIATSTTFETYYITIPAATKYIAIKYYADYQYYLFIDNIHMTEIPQSAEIALTAVTFPLNGSTIHSGEDYTVSGTIMNNGLLLTSFDVTYSVDGGANVATYTVSDLNVDMGRSVSFSHNVPLNVEAGEHTITVTVSNPNGTEDDATDNTITVDFTAVSCETIAEFPYTESFDNGVPTCWSLIDADGDGINWQPLSILMEESSAEYSNSGADAVMSASYDNNTGIINANNWMFSQALAIPAEGAYYAEWYARSLDASYPDTYQAYVATSIDVAALANAAAAANHTPAGSYERMSIDLTNYAGQTIYIAFNHNDSDNYVLILDDFAVKATPTTNDIILTSVAPANGTVITGTPINVSGVVTNNGNALTSYTVSYTVDGGEAVEYNVEGINVAYSETHNFAHPTAITIDEAGTHTIVVTVSNPNGAADSDDTNNSMTITLNAIDCSTITEFPYTEGFENGIPACWTNIDADGDGHNWYFTADLIANWDQSQVEEITYFTHGGNGSVISESYINYDPFGALNANNYLVTPQIALPSDGAYALTFYTANIYDYEENVSVMISDDAFSFTTTLLPEETINVDLNGGEWAERTVSLADYAGQNVYIAIVHTGYDGVGLLIDDVTIAATTAVEENIAEAIAVYPNPANSVITIANAEGQDITIVNTLGQVVSEINNAAANQTIDISNLANGTYFVKVNAEIVKINVVK